MKRIDASGATVDKKWTEGNPATGVLATKLSADWLNILQEEIVYLITENGVSLDQSTTYPAHNTTQLYQAVQNMLSSAGGGGGGFRWNPVSGSAPVETEENSELVYLFGAGLTQKLVAFVKVPQGYLGAKQVKMNFCFYSPAATGTVLFRTTTTLVRKNVDAITSTTNQYVSTNVAVTNSLANQLRNVELDLSNATGQINSVGIASGDLLKIEISRQTDLDTSDVRIVPSATEVRFG